MTWHKSPNNFHKMKLPVKIWYDYRSKYWRLLDHTDTIIADNLTKDLAETLMQAVNYCGLAINFTKAFVECEHIVDNRENTLDKDIEYRNKMRDQALAFLVDLGIVEPPPKYVDAFPVWRNQLMNDFYQKVYNSRCYKYEDDFIAFHKRMVDDGFVS